MKEQRILGNNIQVLLKEKGTERETMAEALGYSESDVIRICEGRSYVSMNEIGEIAEYFGVSVGEMLQRKSDDIYQNAGCIHYNHPFKEEQNLDRIMDLFDLVCDIEEAL